MGNASFAAGQARVGARYVDESGANLYGITGAWGRAENRFISGEFAHQAPRNVPAGVDVSNYQWAGAFGTQLHVAAMPELAVCPVMSLRYNHSSTTTAQRDATGHSTIWGLGAASGFTTQLSPSVRMVPSLQVDFRRSMSSGQITAGGTTSRFIGPDVNYGYWIASLGFVAHGWTIAPTVEDAFAIRNSTAVWGVRASYNFNLSR